MSRSGVFCTNNYNLTEEGVARNCFKNTINFVRLLVSVTLERGRKLVHSVCTKNSRHTKLCRKKNNDEKENHIFSFRSIRRPLLESKITNTSSFFFFYHHTNPATCRSI